MVFQDRVRNGCPEPKADYVHVLLMSFRPDHRKFRARLGKVYASVRPTFAAVQVRRISVNSIDVACRAVVDVLPERHAYKKSALTQTPVYAERSVRIW